MTLAAATAAALILPWTARNYLVFDRFLLLNSQASQVLWNANHPDMGVTFEESAMFPIPADLQGANELLRRAAKNIAADPGHFARLTLSRLGR